MEIKNKNQFNYEKKHIAAMKELYNKFPGDQKPEWLTFDKILSYENLMTRLD